MSDLMTFEDTSSAISLPESAYGHTRCDWPVGTTLDLFGLEAAPASHSAMPVADLDSTIRATSGPNGSGSFESAHLQSCLASKLQAKLLGRGSTLYSMTWKEWITPAGRRFCQSQASARHRKETGFGGWQTPTTRDGKGESGKGNRIRRGKNGKLHVANLCDQCVDLGRRDLVKSTTFRYWLMGVPVVWDAFAPSATRSARKSPPLSSMPVTN